MDNFICCDFYSDNKDIFFVYFEIDYLFYYDTTSN